MTGRAHRLLQVGRLGWMPSVSAAEGRSQAVECLACGRLRRAEIGAVECPACGYVGWKPAGSHARPLRG